MSSWLKKPFRPFILKRHPIPDSLWRDISRQLPLLQNLSSSDMKKLRKWATLFIHEKTFTGVQGYEVTDETRVIIAAQACLLILNLDLEYYDGWIEIVIYPDNFKVNREVSDHNGLIHNEERALSGESWSHGPLILSWDEAYSDSFFPTDGHHVIIHEFSHKLDMLNGRANGMPPLHPSMQREKWTESLSNGYYELNNNLDDPYINRYASTNPAEYFAVISEYFFTAPDILKTHQPDVYEQLTLFYKQDPSVRITNQIIIMNNM